MKKILCICLILVMAAGCGGSSSKYSDNEQSLLKVYGVLDKAENDCDNPKTIKLMLKEGFKKKYFKTYCGLKVKTGSGVNKLIAAGLSKKEIEEYVNLSYYDGTKVRRYLNYKKAKSIKEKVIAVNMNLDKDPYEDATTINNHSVDMLINKYNGLDKDWEPNDLVDVKSVCTIGKDYSCQMVDQIQLEKVAEIAFEKLVAAGAKNDINIVAIAGFRSYSYQQGLYNSALNSQGREYADKYYARPGFSEHNTGLAIDITFNDHNFNEIENYKGYSWIIKNLANYGFILRYTKENKSETLYNPESWHIRYVGVNLAKKLYKNNWSLEYYWATK